MIEITRSNDIWECWIGGRLWEWNDSLEILLKKLSTQSEAIEEDINE